MTKQVDILVLGAGAAGFFAAISAANQAPEARIFLVEKSQQVLSKVKISGGGRCNVTCGEEDPTALMAFYPRGGRMLSRLFHVFGPAQTKEWYTTRGVKLKTEADGRVFPVTDSSQTIIQCLVSELHRCKVESAHGWDIISVEKKGELYEAKSRDGKCVEARRVIVATGGSPKAEGLRWLQDLGHEIVSPLPSLFTFNAPQHSLCRLMGVSVPHATLRIASTKFEYAGSVLITHWGISGPAVLKLSAFAARDLAAMNYRFTVLVNWVGMSLPDFSAWLGKTLSDRPKKMLVNLSVPGIPNSLWHYLLSEAGVLPEALCEQLGKKQFNRLVELCCAFQLPVNGKTTFKEEFVTTGGVSLSSVDSKTMESKALPGLFFAGEVLDMDGITGGYNFQAAWTTGYIAGKNAAQFLKKQNPE